MRYTDPELGNALVLRGAARCMGRIRFPSSSSSISARQTPLTQEYSSMDALGSRLPNMVGDRCRARLCNSGEVATSVLSSQRID
jgi:hypothetical protein